MEQWPLCWEDDFQGSALADHWIGGHANSSREGRIAVNSGLHIAFVAGQEYASCGVVTRQPVIGDLDVRVQFSVDSPSQGSTLELAALSIDPPRNSGLDQDQADRYTRSRVYDVHGAPPYVSSEFDENDGWRIAWNRGSAQTLVDAQGRPMSDNHFNRYGKSIQPPPAGPVCGWLRLLRRGPHWTAYRLNLDDGAWQQTGEVLHMNLPDPVFLRLAAKHWVKEGNPAPAKQIVFQRFELRLPSPTGQPPGNETKTAPPVANTAPLAPEAPPEVRLMQDVRACRECDIFSRTSPYGPFLRVRRSPPAPGDDPENAAVREMAMICDFGQSEPAALYGCRKAPVMLIGINPNLPNHFIIPRTTADLEHWRSGSYRVLRFHPTDADYAKACRHAPEAPLEIADEAALEDLLRSDLTMLVAPQNGRIVGSDEGPEGSQREPERRHARLLLEMADGTRSAYEWPPKQNEIWGSEENLAIVRGRFAAGEVVSGFIDRSVIGREVRVRTGREDRYYGNAKRLLAAVGTHLNASLVLGEDMSLHDVVACASPGWDAKWKLPLSSITANCVGKNRWLHRQIEQSDPKVLLITSRTALGLFADSALGRLSTPLSQLPEKGGGREGLFFRVATEGLWWEREVAGVLVRTRIVLAPHLSYNDNLIPHSYFTQEKWLEFQGINPDAADWLSAQVRAESNRPVVVPVVFGEGDVMVCLDSNQLWTALSERYPDAEAALRALWIDPLNLISGAIASELTRLGVGQTAGARLTRNAGPCTFCRNRWWTIGDGCDYGKPSE